MKIYGEFLVALFQSLQWIRIKFIIEQSNLEILSVYLWSTESQKQKNRLENIKGYSQKSSSPSNENVN